MWAELCPLLKLTFLKLQVEADHLLGWISVICWSREWYVGKSRALISQSSKPDKVLAQCSVRGVERVESGLQGYRVGAQLSSGVRCTPPPCSVSHFLSLAYFLFIHSFYWSIISTSFLRNGVWATKFLRLACLKMFFFYPDIWWIILLGVEFHVRN